MSNSPGIALLERMVAKEHLLVKEDVEEPREISIDRLELVGDLEVGLLMYRIRRQAKEINANLGWRHAGYVLDHQEEIPVEWHEKTLVFSGTLWEPPEGGGYRYLTLRRIGKYGWEPDLRWLGDYWEPYYRLVRLRTSI